MWCSESPFPLRRGTQTERNHTKIKKIIGKRTHLQVLSLLPGSGGPQAILRPRQKRHASGGFFSGERLDGSGLRRMESRGEGERRESQPKGRMECLCECRCGIGWAIVAGLWCRDCFCWRFEIPRRGGTGKGGGECGGRVGDEDDVDASGLSMQTGSAESRDTAFC